MVKMQNTLNIVTPVRLMGILTKAKLPGGLKKGIFKWSNNSNRRSCLIYIYKDGDDSFTRITGYNKVNIINADIYF